MSLTVSEGASREYPRLEDGVYPAVCFELIDLGEQYNETYEKWSRKVLIGWELPGETIEIDGEQVPRALTQRYTASLNEKSALRRDLIAWRGRDFTTEELKAFNLRNIVGAPCQLQVVNKQRDGKTYTNIAAIMGFPRGMEKPQGTLHKIVYDIDENAPEMVEDFPEWIKKLIQSSRSYEARVADAIQAGAKFQELDDEDGQLPF